MHEPLLALRYWRLGLHGHLSAPIHRGKHAQWLPPMMEDSTYSGEGSGGLYGFVADGSVNPYFDLMTGRVSMTSSNDVIIGAVWMFDYTVHNHPYARSRYASIAALAYRPDTGRSWNKMAHRAARRYGVELVAPEDVLSAARRHPSAALRLRS